MSEPKYKLVPVEANHDIVYAMAGEDGENWDQWMPPKHYEALYRVGVAAAPSPPQDPAQTPEWPWDFFPEDHSTWDKCRNIYLAQTEALRVAREALDVLTDGTDATPFEVAQKIGRKAIRKIKELMGEK